MQHATATNIFSRKRFFFLFAGNARLHEKQRLFSCFSFFCHDLNKQNNIMNNWEISPGTFWYSLFTSFVLYIILSKLRLRVMPMSMSMKGNFTWYFLVFVIHLLCPLHDTFQVTSASNANVSLLRRHCTFFSFNFFNN